MKAGVVKTESKQDGETPFEERYAEHFEQVKKNEEKLLAARKAAKKR